jgi:hypothetical protein
MGRPRTGTVFRRSTDGLWIGKISLDGGRRQQFTGHDEATVRSKMAAAGSGPPPIKQGRPRTGTVFRRSMDGLWIGKISVGGGRRQHFYGHDEATVRAKIAAAGFDPPPTGPHRRVDYRPLTARMAAQVVARGRRLGWSDEFVGQVLAASLTRARVLKGVVGPCVYCGNELADTVDHVIPFSRGGDALVSACWPCNRSKGKRTPEEWKGADSASNSVLE